MATALKWLVFATCVILLVPGQFVRTFDGAERYSYLADIMPSDWIATNIWLDSTDCAVQRGAWLALCENGRLVPISERAIADDPGHALLLDLWSMAKGSRATLPEAARLNTLLDTLGLLALAGLLFALRTYLASVVLLALGPAEYLGWMGTSPHWSHIGVASLCAVLPMALAAADLGLLSRRSGTAWVAAGLLFLALATLVRESIGIMGLAVSLGTIGLLALRRPRSQRRTIPLLLAGVLGLAAFSAPRWVVMARDAAFEMQPAQRLATHGLSHTLYLGLGFVENKWGIRYDDASGEQIAKAAEPPVIFCSPEYFRLMWKLYFDRWLEDPIEVARIYIEKAWRLLAVPTLQPGPPFGIVLLVALAHLVIATALGAWRRIGFMQGLIVEGVAIAFLLLYLAQAMAALPSQTYAMPANAFVLVLTGIIAEFFARAVLRVRAAL